jgi:hypothetical protein
METGLTPPGKYAPAGEVGAGRGGDDEEQVLVGRLHAEAHLGRDHEGAQVEGLLAAVRGHPVLVLADQCVAGLDERLDRQLGHGEAAGGALEALGVLVRAEGGHGAVGAAVGLEALEDLLGVVQDVGRRVERDRRVRDELAVVPAAALGPLDGHHVVGEVAAEAGVRQDRRALGVGERAGGGLELDRGRRHEWLSFTGVVVTGRFRSCTPSARTSEHSLIPRLRVR